MTGNRESDFKNANKAMEFKNKPKGYTWHHLDDYNFETNTCTVELVRSEYIWQVTHMGCLYTIQ